MVEVGSATSSPYSQILRGEATQARQAPPGGCTVELLHLLRQLLLQTSLFLVLLRVGELHHNGRRAALWGRNRRGRRKEERGEAMREKRSRESGKRRKGKRLKGWEVEGKWGDKKGNKRRGEWRRGKRETKE